MKIHLPLRAKTLWFYLILTILVLAGIIMAISSNSQVPEHHVSGNAFLAVGVILDAGHGGQDGGAVSQNGVTEAPITLNICKKTQALLRFFGVSAVLTRENEASLGYDSTASLRDNKNADLRERLKIAEQYPDSLFLSIHLNKFGQSQYHGAQVFYGVCHPNAKPLAEALQKQMVDLLDPSNTRVAKQIPGTVYLMERVQSPAVTVECGFLSNPQEERLLQTEAYQTKIAIALTSGYFEYCKGS